MTIPSNVTRNSYTGTGITGPYPVTFKFFEDADLKVTVADADGVETVKTLTTDYTVTGAGEQAGGAITFAAAVTNGYSIVIEPKADLTQDTDIKNEGGNLRESIEDRFDRLCRDDQVQQNSIDRSVKMQVTDASVADPVLPPREAGSLIGWNDAGTGFANRSASLFASDAAITSTGSTTARWISDRFSDVVNVKDFGAVGDGSTDDTAAIQAAIDEAGANGRTVYIPAGQYIVNGTLTVTTQAYSFSIRGDGWGSELRRQSGNVGPMLRIINPGAPSYFQGGTIEDLNILSDSPSDANVGIKLADGAPTGPIVNLRFRNVMINNFISSVENNCESNEINWYDCWFVSGGYGVYDNYGGADWRFFGCHFQALTNWAIYGKMSSVTIVGCTQQSYRDGAKGFYLEDGRCHIIQGCYFEGEPNIGPVAIPPYPADSQSGVIGDGQSIAIQFAGDNRGSLIASNNFDMFYGKAIVINKTDGLTIIGNYFQKCQIGIKLAAEALNVEIGAQSWMPECVVPISYDNPGVTAQSLPHFSGDHKKVIGSPDLGFQSRDDWPSLPAFSVVGTLGAEVTPGGDAASTPEANSTGSWVNYGGTLTTMSSVNTPYTPPDGSYMLRFAGPNGAKGYLALTTVVGQVYRVTFKAKKEAGSPVCVISDAAGDTYSTAEQRRHHFMTGTRGYELVTLTFVATATTTYLMFIMVGTSECFVDTLSVKPATSGSMVAYSGEFTYLNGRKVSIGAPNSGGAGYRTFLVEN